MTDTGIVAVLTATNVSIPKRQQSDCYKGI